MSGLSWNCPCGAGIEVTGRDESSRNAIAAFKAEHAGHERTDAQTGENRG